MTPYEAFDRHMNAPMSHGYWDAMGADDAIALMERFDDEAWRLVAVAFFDPANRHEDWVDRCAEVLAHGPVERVGPMAIAGLLSGDEGTMVRCSDLLRDWRRDLAPAIPPEAIAAMRDLNATASQTSSRLAAAAFLVWAGET